MKKRIFSIFLCIALVLCLLPVPARAAATISSVGIKNLVAPVAGNAIYSGVTIDNAAYKLYDVEWYNVTDDCFMNFGDVFEAGKIYRTQIWVEANSGYEFKYTDSQTPNVTATIDGTAATVTKAYGYAPWAMIVVSRTFDPCPKKEISHVDIVIDPVVENGYVPFAINNSLTNVVLDPSLHTRYFPSGIYWTNMTYDDPVYSGAKFKGGQEYYVEIALKPLYDTYRFTENFTATINGKTANIQRLDDSSAEIGLRYTCFGTITAGDLNPTASLPIGGHFPDFSVTYAYPQCNHIEYANRPKWTEVATGKVMTSEDTFQPGLQYRFEVTLLPVYGYVFERDSNDQMRYTPLITGQKVDSYTYGWNDYYAKETITLVKTFTASGTHTHTPGDWEYNSGQHYQYCTVCEEIINLESHKGGTATCTEKAKCSVCGFAYGPEPEDHKWSPKHHSVGASGHAYICANCKAPEEIIPHTPGAEATETTPQTCTVCGYVIAPAKNHTHNLAKVPAVPATCLKEGTKEHYTCDGCSLLFSDAAGTEITADALGLPKSGHSFDGDVCTVCGHKKDATDTTEPTEPATKPTEKPSGDSGKKDPPADYLLPILIVGSIALGAGLTVVIAVVILKKKKKPHKGE